MDMRNKYLGGVRAVTESRLPKYISIVIRSHDIETREGFSMSEVYGGGWGNTVGVVLVLFILLVIILAVWV